MSDEPTTADTDAAQATDDRHDGPYGPDSAYPNADGSGPDGWTIKATDAGQVFHTTDSPNWRTAEADAWFADEDAARAAGFHHWDPDLRTDLAAGGAAVATGTASEDPDAAAPDRAGLASSGAPVATGSSGTHDNPGDHQVEDLADRSIAQDHVGPHGPGSAQPRSDGSGPAGWTVKATGTGMVYHTPDSPDFDDVTAHAWFVDESTARAAGFVHFDPAKRDRLDYERVGEGPHGAVPELEGAADDPGYGEDDGGDAQGEPGPVGGTLERDGGPADPVRTGAEPVGHGALDTHEREPIADLPSHDDTDDSDTDADDPDAADEADDTEAEDPDTNANDPDAADQANDTEAEDPDTGDEQADDTDAEPNDAVDEDGAETDGAETEEEGP